MIEIPEWMSHGLTAADYEALPEDIRRRIEVVDGGVFVRPFPGDTHQEVVQALASVLRTAARPRLRTVEDVDLRLGDSGLLNRRPDVIVFDPALVEGEVLRPQHCILVVEVMSQNSVTTDQLHKPAEYAQAGIEHFWRVENCDDAQKLTVFRFRLEPTTRTYALVGASTRKLVVSDPLEISIDFAEELF